MFGYEMNVLAITCSILPTTKAGCLIQLVVEMTKLEEIEELYQCLVDYIYFCFIGTS